MGDSNLLQWIAKELARALKMSDSDVSDLAAYIMDIESQSDLKEYLSDLLGKYRKGSTQDVFVEQLMRRWHPAAKTVAEPTELMGYRKKDTDDVLVAPKTETKAERSKRKQGKKATTAADTEGASTSSGRNGSHQGEVRSVATAPVAQQTHMVPAGAVPPHLLKQTAPSQSVSGGNGGASSARSIASTSATTTTASGRRRKFVPMTSAQTTGLQIPGRHFCECQAARHKLISNCTRCGRIVCEQEGSGPCLFCGELVCSRDDRELLARESKRSAKLKEKLMSIPGGGVLQNMARSTVAEASDSPSSSPSVRKARELKDRLLEYDKTSVQRTKVIDDESDYFAADASSWMSAKHRSAIQAREQELHDQRHASRSQQKVTIDFAGRRVVEDDEWKKKHSDALYGGEDAVLQTLQSRWRKTIAPGGQSSPTGPPGSDPSMPDPSDSIANPTAGSQLTLVDSKDPPRVIPKSEMDANRGGGGGGGGGGGSKGRVRVQDKELLEMRDEGVCLSMHQPWATLLVAGIKLDEGRTWYTSHRGRLWIAAAGQAVDQQEVAAMEIFYRNRPNGNDMAFPKEFPCGCLLGCVDVTDCLPQDEYRQKFPNGESESPYVWVCANPQEMMIKFPVKGKHKLWNLEGPLHKAAQMCLQ